MIATFIRALYDDDKAAVLAKAVSDETVDVARTDLPVSTFTVVSGSPFAYWVSNELRELFQTLPAFENGDQTVKQGLATADDFRFVRAWYEVPPDQGNSQWRPFAKGGRRSPFYAPMPYVVNWGRDGLEVRNFVKPSTGKLSSRPQNVSFYFRPGMTWPLRGIRFSAQAVPQGCVFSIAGKMAFADKDDLAPLLGVFNSRVFDQLIAFFAGKVGGVQYEVGLIQKIPVPFLSDKERIDLSQLAVAGWSIKRRVDSFSETSHQFERPSLCASAGSTLTDKAMNRDRVLTVAQNELSEIQEELDNSCFNLYGISEHDRNAMTADLSEADEDGEIEEPDTDDDSDDDTEDESAADVPALTAELVAWAVSVAVGRFDVRLATGEREAPPEPDPFDPLPVCSPGMLTGDDGLPVAEPPAGYPINWPTDGVLVDDPGHPRDLVAAVRSVFDAVFGAESDAYWAEAASILDPKGHDLRTWLAKSFFEHHIKKHSKSRRKAPILWQLGVPSGKYAVWLYAHRVTGDRLFSVLNEVLRPKLDQEESLLGRLKADAGASPTSGQRKEIEAQEDFVAELKTMIEEVARVAPLWAPDLDDGVVICLAPLWRLFPQHKAWQKECKKIWDKLAAGDYDWAHLAMHLWPERVVPKCQDDRSLAIAHGLEDVFWEQDDKEKWHKRKAPGPDANAKSWDDLITRLVNERTSRQVKDALSKLIAAGQAAGNSGTRKRGRTRSK